MNRLTDEQLQQLLEAGKTLSDTGSTEQAREAKLYQLLFNELKQELPVQADAAFSDRVISRLSVPKHIPASSSSHGWVWLGLSVSLLIAVWLVAPVPIDWLITDDLQSVFVILKPIKWGLIFGLSSLLLIQWLDFKLIREPALRKLS